MTHISETTSTEDVPAAFERPRIGGRADGRGNSDLRRHWSWMAFVALFAVGVAACGGGASSPDSGATPRPAFSYDEYATAFCAAWAALFTAVGNPDTAEGSVLSKALDEAVATENAPEAERLAAEITAGLESGRRHVSVAASWPPAAPAMAEFDRVFVAFEAMIAAKAASATVTANPVDPQAAFEQAGGLEAYFAMIDAMRAMPSAGQAGSQQCPDLPVGP